MVKTPAFPVNLQVPFKQKSLAKAAGAKWNHQLKAWTARNPAALYKCREWAHVSDHLGLLWDKEWLDVPFASKDRAKALGARYDPVYRCWYAPEDLVSVSANLRIDQWRMRHLVVKRLEYCDW